MDYLLSSGTANIISTGNGSVKLPIILQLVDFKPMGKDENIMYRMSLSDGIHYAHNLVLTKSLNTMITGGEMTKFAIIQIEEMSKREITNKVWLVLSKLNLLVNGGKVNKVLGQPQAFTIDSLKPRTDTLFTYATPISDVTPYNNPCRIRARVSNKTSIREWSNAKGTGRLFSVDLLDATAQIKMTGFNASVDKFFDKLTEKGVYDISLFRVVSANKQFTSIAHAYELQLNDKTTIIIPVKEHAVNPLPDNKFNLKTIDSISKCSKDDVIDVMGVCKRVGELTTFRSPVTHEEVTKREITLVDMSLTEISLTLWGNQATEKSTDFNNNPVLIVKRVRVTDYNKRTLSLQMSSSLLVNPDIENCHALKRWYVNEGCKLKTLSLTNGLNNAPWMTLQEALENDLPANFFFKCKVIISSVETKGSKFYRGCIQEKCFKEVEPGVAENEQTLFTCQKCKLTKSTFRWRLVLNVILADYTETVRAVAFDEIARDQLIVSPNEITELYKDGHQDDAAVEEKLKKIVKAATLKTFIAVIKSSGTGSSLNFIIVDLQRIVFSDYSKKLLEEIHQDKLM